MALGRPGKALGRPALPNTAAAAKERKGPLQQRARLRCRPGAAKPPRGTGPPWHGTGPPWYGTGPLWAWLRCRPGASKPPRGRGRKEDVLLTDPYLPAGRSRSANPARSLCRMAAMGPLAAVPDWAPTWSRRRAVPANRASTPPMAFKQTKRLRRAFSLPPLMSAAAASRPGRAPTSA